MMTSYIELALQVLKNKGFRITKPRRLVVELLDKHAKALSAYEIKELLDQSGEKVDTVSIYRILDCLEENHLIHRILTTGKAKKCQLEREEHCQHKQADHCHHLLICSQCETIQEVHCPGITPLIERVEALSGFQVQTHNIEFLGLCPRCQ